MSHCVVFLSALSWALHSQLVLFWHPLTLSSSLTMQGHLPHLFLTAECEHDSSEIKAGEELVLRARMQQRKTEVWRWFVRKASYHFQSVATSAWLMLKLHISLSDRGWSHSCFFFFCGDSLKHMHTFLHTGSLLSGWLDTILLSNNIANYNC